MRESLVSDSDSSSLILCRKGDQRRLTIFKRAPRPSVSDRRNKTTYGNGDADEKKLKRVSFPSEAKPVLQELFTRYPPCDGDTTGTSLGIYTGRSSGKQRKWKDDFFGKPQMNKDDIQSRAASLSSRLANDKDFREVFWQFIYIFKMICNFYLSNT